MNKKTVYKLRLLEYQETNKFKVEFVSLACLGIIFRVTRFYTKALEKRSPVPGTNMKGLEMKYFIIPALTSLFLLTGSAAIMAEPTPGELARLHTATLIFNEITRVPEAIPPKLLAKAQGMAIIPGEVKAGFILGGEYGRGILITRVADGTWSPPLFVSLAAGSFGPQIGVESTDLILVFNSARSLNMKNGKITLGGALSVAAGPLGRTAEASTDIPLSAEVYSYSRSSGVFAGASVQGSVLSTDFNANRDFYGIADPLSVPAKVVPESARRFSCLVADYTGVKEQDCA